MAYGDRRPTRSGSRIWRAAAVLLVLATAVVVVQSRSAPAATAASAPAPTAPIWLPFRAPMKIGCVKSNCPGAYHGYWAIDFESLVNQVGAPVYAAGSGRVKIVTRGTVCGPSGTPANVLSIDHGNGVQSVYVHLHDFAVPDGAWVTPSTVIGHVGSTGYTSPCPDYHLHFEVRHNGVSVDPGPLLACQGWKLVSYPSAIGAPDWNSVTPQDTAGGALDPRGREVYSDGTDCASQPYGSSIAVARDADGRLDFIAANAADQISETRETTANGPAWSPWSATPGAMHSVAAATNSDGRIEDFGVTFGGLVYHRWQTSAAGAWTAWTPWPQPGGVFRGVAVTRAADGRLEIVAVSAANLVYQAHQNAAGSSAWTPWTSAPGLFRTVAASTNRDGRMELFGISRGGLVYHRWQRTVGGAWTGWVLWPEASGQFRALAVTLGGDGRLVIVGTSANDVAYTAAQRGIGGSAWSTWVAVPGLMRSVAAATDANGRVEQFAVSRSGGLLYRRVQTSVGGPWTGWQSLSGALSLT